MFVGVVERHDFTVVANYVDGISIDAKAVFADGVTGSVYVVGARDPRRTNRFANGAPLPVRDQNLALDTLAAESQEHGRDLVRAVKAKFGQEPQDLPVADGISLLGWSPSNKLINRPGEGASAAAAEAAADDASDAADRAEAARDALETALLTPVYFDAWEDFSANTTAWPVGTRINTREGMSWDVVSSGQDFTRGDGLKVKWVTGKPLVVFAWGQSNMRGIGDQAISPPVPNRMVWAWNSQIPSTNGTAFEIAQFSSNPFAGSNANQLSWWFCDELQKRTGRRVYMILVAAGGHHIEAFMNSTDLSNNGWAKDPGDNDLYPFMTDQIDTALPLIPGAPTQFDYAIGHQGEANRQDQVEVYARKMRILYKRLETRGHLDVKRTILVAGEICDGVENGRYKERHAAALRRLQMGVYADSFPTMKVVPSAGLEPNTQLDEVHFKADAITALGKRYADAALNPHKIAILDPTTMPDLSVDAGMGWSCSAATATGQVTYWRRLPGELSDFPFTIIEDDTIGWAWLVPANIQQTRGTRMMYRVPPERGFCIEFEARNTHPSAACDITLGCYWYDKDRVHGGGNSAPDVTVAAGTVSRFKKTFSASGSGLTTDVTWNASARWFSPFFQFNADGTGAGCRFNILGMRFF
ncbi:sialate O-acetylesterase [Rhizobiaceae bacterium n13]|uniref:sialate O-acetylesterase n=1 Tax=Ferirhizobium litorale TaxID=2927786 RepID=UPI0024B2F8F4|nr:sialate O-acetylesterase [Fererhizobium litorale]MDI7862525.1 sialate O-acetylesterase [Fererhizobium litorale]